jgi:hypothetical protein
MSVTYLSKTVTLAATGIVVSAWSIADIRIQNNVDPTKITLNVQLVGYVSAAALTGGKMAVPAARRIFRLSLANFPSGIDLTSVTQTQIYNAILAYVTATTTDSLSGAQLATA